MDIGYIRFHKFKYKNSEPRDPVPMDKRWWALKESTPDPSDFEAQKYFSTANKGQPSNVLAAIGLAQTQLKNGTLRSLS